MPDNEKQDSPGWFIWLWMAPVFVMLAYPLTRWMRQTSGSDVALSDAQKRAFSSSMQVNTDEGADQDAAPPELPSGSMSLYNKGGIMPVLTGDSTAQAPVPAQKPVADAGSVVAAEAVSASSSSSGGSREDERKWIRVGSEKGLLTSAVGKVLDKPAVIKAILDNPLVVKAFMNRATVQALVNNPKAMMNFAAGDPRVGAFFGNPVVKAALRDRNAVLTVARSELMGQLLKTPAVKALSANPQTLKAILDGNPQLRAVYDNPNIAAALKDNQSIAPLYMALQMLMQTGGMPAGNQQQEGRLNTKGFGFN